MIARLRSAAIWVLVLSFCFVARPASAEGPCDWGDYGCVKKPEAVGDQGRGAVVTRGLRNVAEVPAGLEGRTSPGSAECVDCEWSAVPACMASDAEVVEISCAGARLGCSGPTAIRFKIYLRRGGGAWEPQGTVCREPAAPPGPVADVGELVRAEVVKYLPDARPTFQPAAGGIVNLPTLFAAGEPAVITTRSFDVLGFAVVVHAQARWKWKFDHEVTGSFTEPGGGYPDMSVSHTYETPGIRQVSVTTSWRATFTLDGDGPFPVPGPEISKTSPTLEVPVHEAHAELVAG